MKKIIVISTLIFILLNVLVCGAHAGSITTQTAIPQRFEIVGTKMTASPGSLSQRPKTYLYVIIKLPDRQPEHYLCSYGDEISKAWFEMIFLAMINQKEITIRYDSDYETTLTLCADYNSARSCTATGQPITARMILGVYFD